MKKRSGNYNKTQRKLSSRRTSLKFEDGEALLLSDKRKKLLAGLVLFVVFLEKVGMFSIPVNITLYAKTKIGFPELVASNIFSVYFGITSLLAFPAGVLSDAVIGTYHAIIIFFGIYLIGFILLPLSAVEEIHLFELSEAGRKGIFLSSLVFLCIGTAGFRANVLPFGAHQIQSLGEQTTRSYYMWSYWTQNLAASISFSFMAYIQQEINFFLGYVIPLGMFILSYIVFVCGGKLYLRPKRKDNLVQLVMSVLRKGLCKKAPEPVAERRAGDEKKTLAAARECYGGPFEDSTVDNVCDLIKVLPIAAFLIIYWCNFTQVGTSFVSQALRMDNNLGSLKVPVAAMTLGNIAVICIGIPIVDRLIVPCMEKIKLPLKPFRRSSIGMVFLASALFAAGIVEYNRTLDMDKLGGSFVHEISGDNFTSSHMSIFWQIPQFALLASSEIFTAVTAPELAYMESPDSMKSMVNGMLDAASGLGGLVSIAIARIVERATKSDPWIEDEINDAKAHYYFYLLGVLTLLNCLGFIVFGYFYKYRNDRRHMQQDDQNENKKMKLRELNSATNTENNISEKTDWNNDISNELNSELISDLKNNLDTGVNSEKTITTKI